MKRNIIIGIIILVVAISVWFAFSVGEKKDQDDCAVSGGVWNMATKKCGPVSVVNNSATVQNASYLVDNETITLVNGLSQTVIATSSASQEVTRYFGNEVSGDLNNDGRPDSAFILTQNSGGSGIFYYLAVALATDQGYTGLNAILLGDRIAPQTTEIKNGQVIVNYADRNPGEPFSVAPSLGVSRYFQVVGNQLQEVGK